MDALPKLTDSHLHVSPKPKELMLLYLWKNTGQELGKGRPPPAEDFAGEGRGDQSPPDVGPLHIPHRN